MYNICYINDNITAIFFVFLGKNVHKIPRLANLFIDLFTNKIFWSFREF